MIYETEEDRRAEAVIMNTILFGGQAAIKLQDTHFADYAVAGKDNRVIAVFEIKDRPGWKEGYGTLFMTADKWCNLVKLSECCGIPVYFAVRVDSGIFITRVARASELRGKLEIDMVERRDRTEAGIKLTVGVPFHLFTPVDKFIIGTI